MNLEKITSIEYIDTITGRLFVHYLPKGSTIEFSFRDDNRTLKIFENKPKEIKP